MIPLKPITKQLIKEYLPAKPIIVEAGAHIGRDTIKMSNLWPEGIIHAFEPVKTLFEKLTAATAHHENVRCYQTALGNYTGTALLHVSSGASTAVSSLLEPKEYRSKRPEVQFEIQEVPITTLDAWARQYGIRRIDFLWLDMQGAELLVLQASPQMLATVQALVVEASLTERFAHNPLYDEIITWLQSQGFTPVQQDALKHDKCNIFFVRA